MDDIDDLIKLLIAIGDIGRKNLRFLEFTWQSRCDSDSKDTTAAQNAESITTMPTLLIGRVVELLKQCKCLETLRILFDIDDSVEFDAMDFDARIELSQLNSLLGVRTVEICGLNYEPLPQHRFANWLKESLQRPKNG